MKKVIITGDDGYKGVGLRVLANALRNDFDLTIIATREQKSGAGGSVKAYGEKEWGEETVDGIKAYWVDGTPADSMEFAQGLFPNGVDYLISGINWGENIGLSTFTASGTGGAALRGYALGIAPKAIIMSWMKPDSENDWWKDKSEDDTQPYLEYPGKASLHIVNEAITNSFWNKDILNVNFPPNPTNEYKITKLLKLLPKFYKYPVIIENNTYRYDEQVFAYDEITKNDLTLDVGAILSGYISITPVTIE
ncbi:hypothetical protein HYV12_00055 [Candidatus Dojkabacteria bacterium]|nr:hypothetical protein [Candidatus Dojkabacteria bacterium]